MVLPKNQKTLLLLVALLCVIFIGQILLFQKEKIGTVIWKYTRNERIADLFISNNEQFYYSVGRYYFNQESYDLDKAEKAFRRVLKINPNASYAHYQLGRIYFIHGKFDRSLDELHTEITLHPENKRTHYMLGLVYGYRGNAGDLEISEQHFIEFTKWATKNWAGYNDLAWIQIRLKKHNEARDTIYRAFEILPKTKDTNPWMWTTLGIAELNLGSYTNARDAFLYARSISEKIDPEYFISAYPGNDNKNANEIFKQYQSTISFNLGIVYEKLGQKDNAKNEYENYLKMIPNGPFPQQNEIIQKIKELQNKRSFSIF
jgi:tetratricopeptide (TPR) repeat protein